LILKAYDSPESFTEPETVYAQAKSRGMDFVTITDHDDIRGCLELVAAHPHDTFISCELTTYFPDDNCKAHILVYGIDELEYEHMMAIRGNIFNLRDYIIEQDIAHSVAHATYDQDGKLATKHIEQLILLFDVFEVINGGSDMQSNQLLHHYLNALDQASLDKLSALHNIKPCRDTPWIKGYTGGSDDHCGILIGSAYTQTSEGKTADANSLDEFIQQLRDKKGTANGMHGNFESYAIGIFKHVHDYRLARDKKYTKSKMNDFLEMFFFGNQGNLIKRFKKSHSLRYLKRNNSRTHKALHKLLKQISNDAEQDIASKIPTAYSNIAHLHDEMFHSVVTALSKHIPNGDIFKGFNRLATLFPMTLLAAPFIGSMRHQVLKSDIKRYLIEGATINFQQNHTEKALWFTDTIDDLNGVSVTLRQIAKHSIKHGYQLKLVTCVDPEVVSAPLPDNSINFTPIKEISLPGYEQQKIGFPSLLSVMRQVILEQPDQIIISTPGPIGLAALMCGKLMDLPVKAIYHTDFAEQLLRMTGDAMLVNVTNRLVNTFYKMADQVFVPSRAYIEKLSADGLNAQKLQLFPRGLDLDLYRPADTTPDLTRRHQLHGHFTILFAGRISADKNLSLLADIATQLNQEKPGLYNFVVAGDGPDLNSLKGQLAAQNNMHFTGRIAAEELIDWYHACDLLVFPSHTDTFGMVVLEAQACGVPCLVTASGGPKEVIQRDVTGTVIHTDRVDDWVAVINEYRRLKTNRPADFKALQKRCAIHVHQQNNWQPVFDAVLGNACKLPTGNSAPQAISNIIDDTASPDRDLAA